MPWGPDQAKRFTKKATSPKLRRQWAHVATGQLGRGLSEGAAIASANSVVKRQKAKRTNQRKPSR